MFYIDNSIDTDTRFDTMKFLNFNEDNVDPLDSFMLLNIPLLPELGTFKITSEEKRPDLISYRIYKDTQYWWMLMIYNEILDINELKSNLNLRYPSKESYEALYQQASLTRKTI